MIRQALAMLCIATSVQAQTPELWKALKFRHIGPEGNRVSSVAGVPGAPNVYYAGAASGGIFKTTDGGVHWSPIFDSVPVSSVGQRPLHHRAPERDACLPDAAVRALPHRLELG